MKSNTAVISILVFLFFTHSLSVLAQNQANALKRLQSASDEQIQQLIRRFPRADRNSDGKLTREEAIGFLKSRMSGGRSTAVDQGSRSVVRNPDFEDVAYGSHPRHRLDVWKSGGQQQRPMIVFIHGGGFRNGDKATYRKNPNVKRVLDEGYAVAALNYPFLKDQPIQEILRDAARAVQFLRSKSEEYRFDPQVMIGCGGSAGAGTSLWLTVRTDLAQPESDDPVARQSSRFQAAALFGTQATYDLTRWDSVVGPAHPEWRSSENEVAEFYGYKLEAELEHKDAKGILAECDMLQWVTADDGPLWIANKPSSKPPGNRGEYLHHFKHAEAVAKACEKCGVSCELVDGRSETRELLQFIEDVCKNARRASD